MSIATEITRLQNAKQSIKTSIENKGVVVSSSDTLDDYSAYIDAINISTQEKTITVQNQTHEITADSGYRGLSKVILDGILVDAHDSYTTSTDSTTAYTKTVPSGALKYANLDKLGGMSYKKINLFNALLVENGTNSGSDPVNSFTTNVGEVDITNRGSASYNRVHLEIYLPVGSYSFSSTTSNTTRIAITDTITPVVDNQSYKSSTINFTISTAGIYYIYLYSSTSSSCKWTNIMLNSGSTALPYQPYFDGTRESAVTSVVVKDSNDTTLDTLTIPSEVQALTGWGWGVNDTCYNYIYYDTTRKKWFYVQKVGRVDLGSLDWTYESSYTTFKTTISDIYTNPTINLLCAKYTTKHVNYWQNLGNKEIGKISTNSITVMIKDTSYGTNAEAFKTAMSGEYLYYELEAPVETDISAYLTDDNFIEVEAGGFITANNTYNQAVPSEITYLVEV